MKEIKKRETYYFDMTRLDPKTINDGMGDWADCQERIDLELIGTRRAGRKFKVTVTMLD
jgi:hypothetical protein